MMAALLDHLWQSTLFAVGAGVLTLLFRRNRAGVRFWLWFAASAKFLIPFATLTAMGAWLPQLAPRMPAPALPLFEPVAQRVTTAMPILAVPAATWPAIAEPLLLCLWAFGTVAIAVRWFLRWRGLRATLRTAVSLPLTAPMPVKSCASSMEPGLVGIWRPVVLLPQGIAARLSPQELAAVLAHEICHYRRRDNLLAAVHMLVEALFWFHPLAWWLGARLNAERERACDEAVLTAGHSAQVYAESILKVCRHYLASPLPCAAGVAGANLRQRIERIAVSPATVQLDATRKSLLAICALAALLGPLAAGVRTAQPSAMPGSQAALRAAIDDLRQSQPRYDHMSKPLVDLVRTQFLGNNLVFFDRWGALTSLIFDHVSPRGFDVYNATYEHGHAQWAIAVTPDGTIASLVFHETMARNFASAPRPGTQDSLRRYVDSLEVGNPNYDEMMPGLAAGVQRESPGLISAISQLGPRKSITFLDRDSNDTDVYRVVFANGEAEWHIAPLTPDGKVRTHWVTFLY